MKLACLTSVKRTKGGKRPVDHIKYVNFTIVIDRSGSVKDMSIKGWEGWKQIIEEQKKTSKNENVVIYVTLVTFDGVATKWFDKVDINTFPNLFPDDQQIKMFEPRGATLLVDTIFKIAVQSTKQYKELVSKYGEDNTSSILLVWTDGDDNQSYKWTVSDLNRILSKIQENPKRTILFTAANQDAVKVGATFGIRAANCMTTQATPVGAPAIYRACSAAVTRGCSGGNAAFTPQERSANAQSVPSRHRSLTPGGHRGAPTAGQSYIGHNPNYAMRTGYQPPRPPFFGCVGQPSGGQVRTPIIPMAAGAPPPVVMENAAAPPSN
jgi:uncharacterized protein YegL